MHGSGKVTPVFLDPQRPRSCRLRQFAQRVRVRLARFLQYVEGMVRGLDDVQRCPRAQAVANRLQQRQIGESVPRPLQKEHRHGYVLQVLRALRPWFVRGMQREPKEDQTANAIERLLRSSL